MRFGLAFLSTLAACGGVRETEAAERPEPRAEAAESETVSRAPTREPASNAWQGAPASKAPRDVPATTKPASEALEPPPHIASTDTTPAPEVVPNPVSTTPNEAAAKSPASTLAGLLLIDGRDPSTRQLLRDYLVSGAGTSIDGSVMRGAVARSGDLLDRCLQAIESGGDPAKFPEVMIALGSELEAIIEAHCASREERLRKLRDVDYRELLARLRRIEEALQSADEQAEQTLRALQKQLRARSSELEAEAELLDTTLTALRSQQRKVGQSLALWMRADVIAPVSAEECKVLRDGFHALFSGRR